MSDETMASQTRQHASDDAFVSASRIRNKATKPCRLLVGSWLAASLAETSANAASGFKPEDATACKNNPQQTPVWAFTEDATTLETGCNPNSASGALIDESP